MTGGRSSYAGAGVDIDAGDRAVELMKNKVARAGPPEVVGGLGGFAGLLHDGAEFCRRCLPAQLVEHENADRRGQVVADGVDDHAGRSRDGVQRRRHALRSGGTHAPTRIARGGIGP